MFIKLGPPSKHGEHHVWKMGVYIAGDDGEFTEDPDFYEVLSGVEGPELLQSTHLDLIASALLSVSDLIRSLSDTKRKSEMPYFDEDDEGDDDDWEIEFEFDEDDYS